MPLAAAAVARTIFGGLAHLWFRSVARRGFPLIQLQSRSLVAKARRNANYETRALWGLHYSGEVYLTIVVAVFWARQHDGQASVKTRDECKDSANHQLLF